MDRLLGLRETAEMVGTPEATLRYWVHLGQPHAPRSAKIGRRRMFREADVETWLKDKFEGASDTEAGGRVA